MMTLPGYHTLEKLYDSTTSQLYRARRPSNKRPVILKALKQIYPPPEKIACLIRPQSQLIQRHTQDIRIFLSRR